MKALRAIALIGLVVLLGCNDTLIDPFQNEGKYYTVWGYLDGGALNHEVRIIPVSRLGGVVTDTEGRGSSIDATVVSINLSTGRETVWDHDLAVLADSTFGHLFRASFQLLAGGRYRLEVRRSDGVTAWAETTVPRLARTDHVVPGTVIGQAGERTQEVTLDEIPAPYDIEVLYRVDGPDRRRTYAIPYGQQGEQTASRGWRFSIELDRDMPMAREAIAFRIPGENKTMGLAAIGVRAKVIADEWVPPAGIFDPDFLVVPGALSNVQNGYGFWGAFNTYTQDWEVSREFSLDFGWDF